jgi:hypothetical protein
MDLSGKFLLLSRAYNVENNFVFVTVVKIAA